MTGLFGQNPPLAHEPNDALTRYAERVSGLLCAKLLVHPDDWLINSSDWILLAHLGRRNSSDQLTAAVPVNSLEYLFPCEFSRALMLEIWQIHLDGQWNVDRTPSPAWEVGCS